MRFSTVLSLTPALLLLACQDGQAYQVSSNLSYSVASGTYYSGKLQAGKGPKVVDPGYWDSFPAESQQRALVGTLGEDAVAVAVSLDDEEGYWVKSAGVPSLDSPKNPTFSLAVSFTAEVAVGKHVLHLAAVNEQQVFGALSHLDFELSEPSAASGELIVSLSWDQDADLDLHLILPDGTEVDKSNPNSWSWTGLGLPPADAWKSGGILDRDSNAECVIDGLRRENVSFQTSPPSGHYLVRVDTYSLCSVAAARYEVKAVYKSASLGSASGLANADSTLFPHGTGGGVKALEFEVP